MKRKSIIVILLLLLLAGFTVIVNPFYKSTPPTPISTEEIGKVEVTPVSYELGKILMKGGIVAKEYEIKNGASQSLYLKKIVTSCMCTKASVTSSKGSTSFYGMEMSGDKNPKMNLEIPSGTTATLKVRFDPAAHGIQGVGSIDRSVWLTFADPVGIKEVKFSGEVVLAE